MIYIVLLTRLNKYIECKITVKKICLKNGCCSSLIDGIHLFSALREAMAKVPGVMRSEVDWILDKKKT